MPLHPSRQSSQSLPSGPPAPPPASLLRRTRRILLIAAAIFVALPILIAFYLAARWPYSDRMIQPALNKAFHGDVKIESFHAVFLPHPGFIATGLSLRRGPTPEAAAANPAPPLATASRVIVEGRYIDLLMLQHRVRLVQVESLHITIPPADTPARAADFPPGDGKDFSGPRTFIENLRLQNALLEVQKQDTPADPFLLHVEELLLQNVVKDHAATFSVDLQNPRPDATIHAAGSLGPLHSTHLNDTPVDANFTFVNGKLEDFKGLHGTIDAAGRFHGILSAIDVEASAATNAFAVNRGRPIHVDNRLQATVNGLNGDTFLRSIDAHTGSTTVHAVGSVTGKPKVTDLDLRVNHGRIEEVMRPFLSNDPPVAGDLHMHGHATLAAVGPPFLQRLTMNGIFDIPNESFTKATTEQSLSAFSRRADGLNPRSPDAKPQAPVREANGTLVDPNVVLSVRGRVHLGNGIASTPRLDVYFPGATMQLAGTFNLKSKTAHLLGNLDMKADISHVTTGFKSFLLKPLSPFFKHSDSADSSAAKVTIIPIAITGTGKFKVSSNILGKK